jgi:membrane protein DedA with SNARE-associated domain
MPMSYWNICRSANGLFQMRQFDSCHHRDRTHAGCRLGRWSSLILSDALVSLIPIYGPWIIFAIVALESSGVPLPGETILVAAALLAATTDQIDIIVVVLAATAGAIVGDGMGYMIGRWLGLPFVRRYGRYIRLDENRLLIGRYLFFQYGNAVVFFGRFIAVLRMFAALLAGASRMPAGRFFFFNITGGICWACLFGFGAYAVGSEFYRISGALTVVSLGLFIAAGIALSIFIRRYEVTLRRRAEIALSDH